MLGAWALIGRSSSEVATDTVTKRYVFLGDSLTPVTAVGRAFALSPDGRDLAYVSGEGPGQLAGLALKRSDMLAPTMIPGSQQAKWPVFSPDGSRLLYVRAFLLTGSLEISSLDGNSTRVLVADSVYVGAAWGDDGYIYYSRLGSLLRIPVNGGPVDTLTTHRDSSQTDDRMPVPVAGGHGLFFMRQVGTGPTELMALDLGSHETRHLGSGQPVAISQDRILLFSTDGVTVQATRFDPDRLTLTGEPVQITPNLERNGLGIANVAFSASGSVIYWAEVGSATRVYWVDRSGGRREIDPDWQTPVADSPKLSPDGRRLALAVRGALVVKQLDRGPASEIIHPLNGHNYLRPRWRSDGRFLLAYQSGVKDSVVVVRDDGLGGLMPTVDDPRGVADATWSPDGQWLVFRTAVEGSNGADIYAVRADGTGDRIPVATSPGSDVTPVFSPDRHWLAYVSDESGDLRGVPAPLPQRERPTDQGLDPWREPAAVGGDERRTVLCRGRQPDDGHPHPDQSVPRGRPAPTALLDLALPTVDCGSPGLRRHRRWPAFRDDRRRRDATDCPDRQLAGRLSGAPPMSLESLQAALADRYAIERELGAGGMATVYLAQDLKHDRKVAIKVLRPELAAIIGADRFLSEIKTTANLQHPHILPLFDSGKVQGNDASHGSGLTTHLFYVMPFVEGESLRDRLDREKQLAIADAVRIASEVASALDYAHRHNVIHRDIKPENILLHDGQALVADFGIALAAARSDGGTRMTETGMSSRHAALHEPRAGDGRARPRRPHRRLRARLRALRDARRRAAVHGPTAQSIIAKVMTEKPTAPSATRDTVPEAVEDAVLIALAKLPVDRFASAAEFASALAGQATGARTTTRRAVASASPGPYRRLSMALGATALVLAAVAAWALLRRPAASGPSVYDVGLPDSARMSFVGSLSRIGPYGALTRNLSVAPNGEFVVYTATQGDSTSLWVRSLGTTEVRELPGTEGATGPRVSPDASQVGYFNGDRMMAAPIDGGDPRLLMMAVSGTLVDWTSTSQFVTVDNDGYRFNRFDPGTGSTKSATIARCAFGVWVPDTQELLCSFNGIAQTIDPASQAVTTIRIANPDGSPGAPASGSAFRIIEGRYLLWLATDGNLVVAGYDPARHLAGPPTRMLAGIRREALGEGQYDISTNGTLVYAPGLDATIGRLVRFHPGRAIEPLLVEDADYQRYDLTRDGRWLAAVTPGSDAMELRIYDLQNGQRSTWLRAEAIRHAMWNPGGDKLLIAAQHDSTWVLLRGVPGSGQPVDTLATWGPGGDYLDPIGYPFDSLAIAVDWSSGVVADFDPRRNAPVFDTILTGARFPSVAPGGRLITYQTVDESRIVVTTFPKTGRRWQVATLGVEPIWLSDTELLYRFGASWYLVRVNPATGEPQGAATLWGRDPRFSDTSGWSNRPDHAGGVIYVESPQQPDPSYLRVIPNWVAQMKRIVDGAKR